MRILMLAFQNAGGGMQVAISIINEFKKFKSNEYHIIIGERIESQLNGWEFPDNFKFYSMPLEVTRRSIGGFIKRAKFFSEIENRVNPDCILTTSGPIYWRSKSPHLLGFNTPASIYTESPYFQRMPFSEKIKWKVKAMLQCIFIKRDAEAYFVQTDDVNKRLRKFINKDNVYTISNTYSNIFKDYKRYPPKLPTRTDQEIRLLTLSTYYPHKNFEIIMSVVDILKNRGYKNIKFVLTLKDEVYKRIIKQHYSDYIINVGPLPSLECPSLYEECDFVFLPSLLECFSANYAEGMCMGKPILTSDMSFARTVCHDAAIYFNPLDANDIADKILNLVFSDQIIEEMKQKGWKNMENFGTAEKRAEEILNILNMIRVNVTQ